MKKIINPSPNGSTADIMLFILRAAVGILLLTHGFPKFQRLISGEPIQFASIFGMSETVSLAIAMFAEFICAVFVMFGFFTRIAAVPIILTMLVIIFSVHGDDPFSKKELPYLYLISYTYLLFRGAGKISVDHLVYKKLKPANRPFRTNPF